MTDSRPPSKRKTKIIATIGPASDDLSTLERMIKAGLNVARLNLSHGNYTEHARRAKLVRRAAANLGVHVAIMADTRGIEVRTGRLESEMVFLEKGQDFSLRAESMKGNKHGVSVSYDKLSNILRPGNIVFLDDGGIELIVKHVSGLNIQCKVVHGGMLREKRGVNFPGIHLPMSALSPEFLGRLEDELDFAVTERVDYLAASFTQSDSEIAGIRAKLRERGAAIPIIAKIENQAGVHNMQAIVSFADGIMVARGDLGVELPLAQIPITQKQLIQWSVTNGKPAITATQMLASMVTNPKPTRAEASDVANAILDGSSAVMLSGETAIGQYPIEAIETMADIASLTEASLQDFGVLQTIKMAEVDKTAEALCQAAARLAEQMKAAAIITLTDTGYTARLISRHRPESIILAATGSEQVARRLALNWGVIPLLSKKEINTDDEKSTQYCCQQAKKLGFLKNGDVVVVTHGTDPGSGGTDLIRVVEID